MSELPPEFIQRLTMGMRILRFAEERFFLPAAMTRQVPMPLRLRLSWTQDEELMRPIWEGFAKEHSSDVEQIEAMCALFRRSVTLDTKLFFYTRSPKPHYFLMHLCYALWRTAYSQKPLTLPVVLQEVFPYSTWPEEELEAMWERQITPPEWGFPGEGVLRLNVVHLWLDNGATDVDTIEAEVRRTKARR